ncbi:MAG: hypothetical protein SVU69_12365 [Pseudomonadota bacterium]|nr:hypothetical protein [Pseudomonadota bacterium]
MEISAPKIELDSEELETTLWRYMNFPKFVSMLDRQGLWLARSDTFRDLHEGRFPDDIKRHMDQVYKELEQKKEVSKKIRGTADFQEHLRKNMFLSCWHKNTEENMVMWELYGRDRNATVAIQTTAKIIQESIKKECPSPSAMTPFHGLIIKNVAYQEADEPLKVMRYEDFFSESGDTSRGQDSTEHLRQAFALTGYTCWSLAQSRYQTAGHENPGASGL